MKNVICAAQNRIFSIAVQILDDDEPYKLQSGERIVFGVKKHPANSEYIISKELTSSNYDTETNVYITTLSSGEMNIDAGIYYYDVALRYPSGELEKVIGCNEFRVEDSVVRSR